MKEYDLLKLVNDKVYLDSKLNEFLLNKIILKQKIDSGEISGHIQKAEHNLRFVHENLSLGFFDWSITGCYYACYHAALALILTKGYSSKNHVATLCVLIKEFYGDVLNFEDVEILSTLLDYQDVLFYVESKNRREDATYSTKIKFDKKDVGLLKFKSISFVAKINNIIKS